MVHLVGNVVRDATVETVNEKKLIKFTLALNKRFVKSTGEVVKSTTYVDCEYWKKSDVYIHITKGKLVEVVGSLSHRAYTNRQGQAVPVLQLNVALLELHSSKNSDGSGKPEAGDEDEVEPVTVENDLPF